MTSILSPRHAVVAEDAELVLQAGDLEVIRVENRLHEHSSRFVHRRSGAAPPRILVRAALIVHGYDHGFDAAAKRRSPVADRL
jgi:hypothetical protein